MAKLELASEPRLAAEAGLAEIADWYCGNPARRAWNEARCAGLEARSCTDGTCRYRHFGSCSGVLLGDGVLVTAAHCLAPIADQPELLGLSQIVVADAAGRPARRLPLGAITLGKRDLAHGFVSIDEEYPIDVAFIEVDDGGLPSLRLAPRPLRGDGLFIVGYPRVERRPAEARARAGYELTYGTPTASFGALTDANSAAAPFCSVDGLQEHWALSVNCERGSLDDDLWRGPITFGALMASYDTCNGYSGAPVFDLRGRLVGINSTIAAVIDPQQAYSADTRAVLISIDAALEIRSGVLPKIVPAARPIHRGKKEQASVWHALPYSSR